MAFASIFAPTPKPAVRRYKEWAGKLGSDLTLQTAFSVSTWLLLGAALQSLIVLVAPSRYVVLPALLFLVLRVGDTMLITWGWKENPYMKGAIMQKVSAQVPDKDECRQVGAEVWRWK